MTNKDEASPRQRVLMEQRWEGIRKRCGAGTCDPQHRMHATGCTNRTQKVKVTNLNTGEVVDASIDHSDARAVKDVLVDHDKQAVRLEPLDEVFTTQAEAQEPLAEENWSRWERGVFEERFENDQRREVHQPRVLASETYELNEAAPARPWWKRVFRRG